MNDIRGLINQTVGFAAYLVLQFVVFRHAALFNTAYCYVYIGALIFFPVNTGMIRLMLIAFFLGLSVDFSYQTIGIHAAGSVAAVYLRHLLLKRFEPAGGYDTGERPLLNRMTFARFSQIILPILFAHQFIILLAEASDRDLIFPVLIKTVTGALYTFAVIFILQKIFYGKKSFN